MHDKEGNYLALLTAVETSARTLCPILGIILEDTDKLEQAQNRRKIQRGLENMASEENSVSSEKSRQC